MNRSFSKIRHIQEANSRLEKRILSEKNVDSLIKSVLKEAYLPLIQEGDDLCDILCGIKQAKFGSNGDAVKMIQSALAKCGHNVEKQGGGIIEGCKDDYTKCDGKFRLETKKAVEDFQDKNQKTKDGSVGQETLKALINGKCLENPNCDCTKVTQQDTPKDGDTQFADTEMWWTLIGKKNDTYGDCKKINACLYSTLTSSPVFNWDNFVKCMETKIDTPIPVLRDEKKIGCAGCPEYINRMPAPGKPFDQGKRAMEDNCIKLGCSRVAY